ncbi:MAG: glycosyltransferase family 39 protein [Chloroflexota bacterium]
MRSLRFWLLLGLFVAGALLHQAVHPVMEGLDEALHYNYVTLLRTENHLPDRATRDYNSTRQESGQPPLTYWVAARFLDLLNLPATDSDVRTDLRQALNPWSFPRIGIQPGTIRRNDNHNLYYHGVAEQAIARKDIVQSDLAARLPSVIFGMLAVIGAYGASREIFRRTEWALVATALFALMPQMVYMNAILTNDISGTAFATLATWQALRLLRRGASPQRLLLLGALLGLCGLSKVNALAVAPGVGLALLFDWRNRRLSFIRLIANGLLVGVAMLIILGPWLLYGAINYGDPLGVKTHDLYESTQPAIGEVIAYLPEIYLSYWGKVSALQMSPIIYGLFTALALLSLLGYGLFIASRQRIARLAAQQAVVLGTITLVTSIALLQWLIRLFSVAPAITGRLLYPAHIAIVVGLTGGLALLAARLPRCYDQILRLYAISLVAVASLILSPVAIMATFAPPPTLTPAQLPKLQGSPVDFDGTIRFLGYTQTTPFISEGTFHTMTLCWQVLKTPTRPGAFSLKFFDGQGKIVGQRTSAHGMGRYNTASWQPGAIFCDDVNVLVNGPLQPGQSYNAVLAMLDDLTMAFDWKATTPEGKPIDVPLITQVITHAGDLTGEMHYFDVLNQPTIMFPGLATLETDTWSEIPTPGKSIKVDLLWDVTGRIDGNYAEFFHLIGPNTALVLSDSVPRGGQYPTSAWSPGEKVADHWQLDIPANLAPGTYEIQFGFYRQDTGERLPTTLRGKDVLDRSIVLSTFEVK